MRWRTWPESHRWFPSAKDVELLRASSISRPRLPRCRRHGSSWYPERIHGYARNRRSTNYLALPSRIPGIRNNPCSPLCCNLFRRWTDRRWSRRGQNFGSKGWRASSHGVAPRSSRASLVPDLIIRTSVCLRMCQDPERAPTGATIASSFEEPIRACST